MAYWLQYFFTVKVSRNLQKPCSEVEDVERYFGYIVVIKMVVIALLVWMGSVFVNCINSIPVRHLP